KPEPGI
ncbi:hypothetical protein BN1708_018776, partial [Verticillium longisporum]